MNKNYENIVLKLDNFFMSNFFDLNKNRIESTIKKHAIDIPSLDTFSMSRNCTVYSGVSDPDSEACWIPIRNPDPGALKKI